VEHFKRWAKNPAVRDWICRDCMSPEERERRLREIFGLPPVETPDATSDGLPESDSIQPNQTSCTHS